VLYCPWYVTILHSIISEFIEQGNLYQCSTSITIVIKAPILEFSEPMRHYLSGTPAAYILLGIPGLIPSLTFLILT
jgi:hypothetical protein